MGNISAAPLPELPNKNFLNISIYNTDSLVMLYPSEVEVETVRNAIIHSWRKGILKEELLFDRDDRNNCLKFKLRGFPFVTVDGKRFAEQARLMCIEIFKGLFDIGWRLIVSSTLSRHHDLKSWFFQKNDIVKEPCQMFAVCLSSNNKLQLLSSPQHLHEVARQICRFVWLHGIQSEESYENTYQIKLDGRPWQSSSKVESYYAINLITEIIQRFSFLQYEIYGNCNLTGTLETLIFKYNPTKVGIENFLIISMSRSDRLSLFNASVHTCHVIKETVTRYWQSGIQDEKMDDNCFELKLKGSPWWADIQEAIHSRQLMCKILEALSGLGFFVVVTLDISAKENEKPVLIFQQAEEGRRTCFMCVSLGMSNKIRFINAPENVVEAGVNVIHDSPLGTINKPVRYDGTTYEVVIRGDAWSSMCKGDGIHGRSLVLGLLCQFYKLGWRLICSTDISSQCISRKNNRTYPTDVDSLWFMYDDKILKQSNVDYSGIT